MTMQSIWTSVALVASAIAAQPLQAQHWTAEAQVGQQRHPAVAENAGAPDVSFGIRYDKRSAGLLVSGGVPLAADDPYWAAAGAWRRATVEFGRLTAGLDLSGVGFGFLERSDDDASGAGLPGVPPGAGPGNGGQERGGTGYGLVGRAQPLLAFRAGALRVEGRTGAMHVVTGFDGDVWRRTLRESDLELVVRPTFAFDLGASLRHVGSDTLGHTMARLNVQAVVGRGSVRASAGRWLSGETRDLAWEVGALFGPDPRATLSLSARHEPFDPVYLTGARTSWQAGLAIRVGGSPIRAAPVPAAYVNGTATIELPVRDAANRPSIAGDFNDWNPEPMERAGDAWRIAIAVEPGVYNYAFVTADGEWFVPESVPGRRSDGMGGYVAVLVVGQ